MGQTLGFIGPLNKKEFGSINIPDMAHQESINTHSKYHQRKQRNMISSHVTCSSSNYLAIGNIPVSKMMFTSAEL